MTETKAEARNSVGIWKAVRKTCGSSTDTAVTLTRPFIILNNHFSVNSESTAKETVALCLGALCGDKSHSDAF